MVALTELVSDPALGLEVVACPESLAGRRIDSAAVSELASPGKWLQGGELLMTIGLLLPMTAEACAGYVAELAASGVQALGLGLGAELPYQEAPDALVAAASSVGMPLLTVPDGVPFIAVTKAVFAMQAAEERRELEWALQSQRAMTEAAVNPGGLASILESHHRATDVGAAVVDLGGRVLASFGCDGDDLALASATLVESIRDRGLDVAAADTQHGVRLEVHPLGSRRLRGWLLMDDKDDRAPSPLVTAGLVSVLTLELERRHAFDEADRRLRSQAFDRLTRPRIDDVTAARVLSSIGLEYAARRCAAVQALPDEPASELAADLAAGLPDALVRTQQEVVEISTLATVDLRILVARLAPGRPLGIGGHASPPDLVMSLRQARSALAASRILGEPVSSEDIAAHDALAFLPTPMLLAYADAVLSPLDAADRSQDLLAALQAFLTANGSWETAAEALQVHRHTVRNRVARIEATTGRSLDNAQDRLELALALHARSRREDWRST